MNKGSLFNYIGSQYPFYLSNYSQESMTENYYLYGINSPGLSEKLVPYFSFTKTVEKIFQNSFPRGNDTSLLSLVNPAKSGETNVEYLTTLLSKDNAVVVDGDKRGEFPKIELQATNYVVRSLVTNLRCAIKSKFYKFYPSRFVDVLWTRDEFLVFRVCRAGDGVAVLKPIGLYKNTDTEMKNPLPVNLNSLENLPRMRFNLTETKPGMFSCPEMEAVIRRYEWESFENSLDGNLQWGKKKVPIKGGTKKK